MLKKQPTLKDKLDGQEVIPTVETTAEGKVVEETTNTNNEQ